MKNCEVIKFTESIWQQPVYRERSPVERNGWSKFYYLFVFKHWSNGWHRKVGFFLFKKKMRWKEERWTWLHAAAWLAIHITQRAVNIFVDINHIVYLLSSDFYPFKLFRCVFDSYLNDFIFVDGSKWKKNT